MDIVDTFEQVRGLRSGSVGFTPTLGMIHEGHLSLMKQARAENDQVIVSVFVNPLQFGAGEDFETYPRSLERDAELIARSGADVLFAPSQLEMYPMPPATTVEVRDLSMNLDGASRPTHFAGVAMVVAKFFAGIQPDRAYFGRKDAQQLAIITRLALDLSMPVQVVGCSTVREADGLALSSRNVYLDSGDRAEALALSSGLMAAADLVEQGETRGPALESAVRRASPEFEFEYVALMDRATVSALDVLDRPAFLAVAGHVGPARLIDNIAIDPSDDGFAVDRGVRLREKSLLYGA